MSEGGSTPPLTRPRSAAVIIPAKDEAQRIEATVLAARDIEGVDLVIVVDDGSVDATAALAKGAGAVVVRHKTNRGKAAAMETGAKVVHMREEAERAGGEGTTGQELLTEPRERGHTGPLPIINPEGGPPPRALLFIDADMEDSARNASALVAPVLKDGVDMSIAVIPPQEGASGMGLVVRTSRNGIRKATGFETEQPLSGTRCITRETWEAVQPLAAGWGVETGLTIDALHHGFWVKEVPADLHHRATGSDFRGQLHRASQLRDVVRALAKRRSISPNDPLEDGPRPDSPVGDPEATGRGSETEAPRR
ncbi:MAG: glycosyltransferase [Dermabacter sp.]|nr:glycosyltransferase [Dermabacter sp.]